MRAATFVVISCALAVALLGGGVDADELLEIVKRCAGESQLGDLPVKALFKHEGEPDKKIKCFVACMARENDVLQHGKFNKDKIFSMLPADMPNRDKAVEVLAKCSDERGSDDCETAFLGSKCLQENQIHPPFLPEQE